MKKGATGADVWWLQTKLTILGYYGGTVTGGYYDGTVAAVKAFQKDAGLKTDGVAGPLTLKALYEDPAYALPDTPPGEPTQVYENGEWADHWIPVHTIEPPPDGEVWLTPPPPPDDGGLG